MGYFGGIVVSVAQNLFSFVESKVGEFAMHHDKMLSLQPAESQASVRGGR